MKKVVLMLTVALLIFALFADPSGLGAGARKLGGWLEDGAIAVITFVRSAFGDGSQAPTCRGMRCVDDARWQRPMTDSDHALRVLHPMPGVRWTEIREAAVDCAGHGWPVLPGTYQLAEHSAWLGKREAVGLEPVAEFWQMSTTTSPATAMEWWTRRPYSVLLACGSAVDVLEVPAAHGERIWPHVAEGAMAGPIAVSPLGTWLLSVRCGGKLQPELAAETRLHTAGCWVPLPPTTRGSVPYRWRVAPVATSWILPDAEAVQCLLVKALALPSA